MKLILARDGSFAYDVTQELDELWLELEVEVMLDRLMEALSEKKQVSDSELLQALMNSPWEQEMRACGT